MDIATEDYMAFWAFLSEGLDAGKTVISILQEARSAQAGKPLDTVISSLIKQVEAGKTISEAMGVHKSVFPGTIVLMVKAGEAGGVLNVTAGRIAEGLKDGSFAAPGARGPEGFEMAHYWGALAVMMKSGVPVLQALDVLLEEVADQGLKEATGAIRKAVLEGRAIARTLGEYAHLFPPEIVRAVETGEKCERLDETASRIAEALAAGDLSRLHYAGVSASDSEDATEAVKLVNLVIRQAVKNRASDIHFEPTGKGLKIRHRVDGALYEMEPPPARLAQAVVNRLKVMGAMDLAESRRPQDGRIMLDIEGKPLDLRASCVPTIYGERVVMRILDRGAVCLDLERIGLTGEDLNTVRRLAGLPNGIIICAGPTGSGKTTLEYAMLNSMERNRQSVFSVEDPVEYAIEGVSQIPISPKVGLTFSRALRSVLRQDPDVIMVGEMRDLESLQVAVQCALTGHLVLTTLHSNDAPGTLRRLLDIGLEPFMVNQSVVGVIGQRLVRVLCKSCRKRTEPKLNSLPPTAAEFVKSAKDAEFYVPDGCKECRGVGYKGRTAIHEILIPDDGVKDSVSRNVGPEALREASLRAGMKPMLVNGLEKAARGITSIEEVCRVAGN